MSISKNKKSQRKRFIDVDPFQKKFGPVSEKAIYDVFQTVFNVESHNMRKYTFPHCVQQLRKYKTQQKQKEERLQSSTLRS
tara:strand:- start:488 stop:730 length:243 start_codon:yes stop_codon:yes gene_type:complete